MPMLTCSNRLATSSDQASLIHRLQDFCKHNPTKYPNPSAWRQRKLAEANPFKPSQFKTHRIAPSSGQEPISTSIAPPPPNPAQHPLQTLPKSTIASIHRTSSTYTTAPSSTTTQHTLTTAPSSKPAPNPLEPRSHPTNPRRLPQPPRRPPLQPLPPPPTRFAAPLPTRSSVQTSSLLCDGERTIKSRASL